MQVFFVSIELDHSLPFLIDIYMFNLSHALLLDNPRTHCSLIAQLEADIVRQLEPGVYRVAEEWRGSGGVKNR